MRRRIDASPRPPVQGREYSRMLTLMLMLALVGMLMYRARDPKMWAMFGGVAENTVVAAQEEQKADGVPVATESTADVPPPDYGDAVPPVSPQVVPKTEEAAQAPAQPAEGVSATPAEQPLAEEELALDQDSEEQESLLEEFQVIADKEFFNKEEMAAYYRLLRWARSQTVEQLQKKAEVDPRFGDIFTRPDDYRGRLLDFRLHVRQAILHKDLEKDNPAGVNKLWELTGYNDSSGTNFYMCVTDKLPAEMAVGPKIMEDGRFVGYFLKLMAYEDGEGKTRAIPVFIGKFVWDPPISQKADPKAQEREVMWALLAAAVVAVVLFVRWGLGLMKAPRRATLSQDPSLQMLRRRQAMEKNSEEESVDIDTWLDRSEAPPDESAINPPENDDSEGEDSPRY